MRMLPVLIVFLSSSCASYPKTTGAPAEMDDDSKPPAARVEVVRDTYFGISVADPYRWMESQSQELQDYLHAQNAHARSVLDRIATPRRALLERIRELQAGTAHVRFVQRAGDQFFFLETPADGDRARIVQHRLSDGHERVLVEPGQFDLADRRASIDFLEISPDGRYVAFAVSHAGAENWTLRVVDTASRELLGDAIPMIAYPIPSWSADASGFYYSRLQDLPAGAPETQRYDNIRVYFHALQRDSTQDRPVFGPGVVPGLELPGSVAFFDVSASADGRHLLATQVRGTDYNARAVWVHDLRDDEPRWRQVAGHADLVSVVQADGDSIYAISSKGAPNGQVLKIDAARGTTADATVLVPESEVVISTESGFLGIARDALYVLGQRDGFGVVRRVDHDGRITELDLPHAGVIIEFTVGRHDAGACFGLQSPVLSSQVFCHDPGTDAIASTGLIAPDPADYSNVSLHRAEVESTDGARVPLTIVGPRDLERDGTHPVLLTAYGAYGSNLPMWFVAPNLAWYEQGGVIVFVHARGGGERGTAWHHAARRTGKQRTIDDVLAAARWLIEEGYTSPRRLAIAGKSAGGIPTGGAITQRPELFRAALFRVTVTDLLRFEQSSAGPANRAEFGSTQVEEELRVLHAISPYASVRDGVAYPAVMLETGVNDPRVPPWQLAKMTARLQAASSSGLPVLLRVDYETGHGLGTDKRQAAELLADEYAFLGWQLGMPGFEPTTGAERQVSR